MTEPRQTDDLAQRYIEASAQDPRRPPDRVRDAARAHALDVIASKALPATANRPATNQPAANQSRWKMTLLASVALAGMTGLLVLQFERGTAKEKEIALGQPVASSAAAPPAAPATAPVLAPATPQELPPAAAQAKTAAKPDRPTPAMPAPAPAPPMADSNATKAAPPATQPEPSAPEMLATPLMRPRPAPQAPARLADAAPAAPAAPAADASGLTSGSIAPPATATAPGMREAAPTLGAARAKASRSQDLQQAFIEAARTGNTAQLENLLQQGAQLNAADETGRTALIWAAISNQTATAQKLLALGASTAIQDRDGLNALQHARRLGLDSMATLLAAVP